jgi:hypothetical protein
MFCFQVESDVAQRLQAAGLGDHLADELQTTIMSRLREVYLGVVAEEVEHSGRLDADALAASAGGPSYGALIADYGYDHDPDAGAERVYVRRGPDGVVDAAVFQAWAWPEGDGAIRAVDVTIRLAVTRAGDGQEEWERELRQRVDQAVNRYLRSAGDALVLPDMSSLLITVEHVGKDDEAHLRVAAADAGGGVRGRSWAHDAEPRDLAEALAGQLGLRAAGPFGPEQALLGPRHIGLLRALAVNPEDVRDRLGWVRAGRNPADDQRYLDAAAMASPLAEYAARREGSMSYAGAVAHERTPDGALTQSAVEYRFSQQQKNTEELEKSVQIASVELADGVTDEDVREILGRPGGEHRWPELVSYLARRDQGQRFDKNQPADDWPSLKVAGKWTVWYDIGLEDDDWRFDAIRRAAQKIEDAGYELKEIQFLLAKYNERIIVKKGRAVRSGDSIAKWPAYFSPEVINIPSKGAPELSADEINRGLYELFYNRLNDHRAALIVHEYGHYLHDMNRRDLFLDQEKTKFYPEYYDRMFTHVSRYANKTTQEAVAELFVKEVFGFPLEDWEKQILTALGAARPSSEPREAYRNPQPAEGLLDQVLEILARRPGGAPDAERVTAVITGLTAGERHMDPRLIADRVQRILESEGRRERLRSGAPVPAVLLGGEQGYIHETESMLTQALDGMTNREDPSARLYAVAGAWYPRRWDEDDTALGLSSPWARLASALGGDWRPVGPGLGAVMNRTDQLGHGAGAFLLSPPPGRADPAAPRNAGFAYALRNLGGSLFLADLQGAPSRRVRPVTDPSEMPVLPEGTRVIVTGSDGHAVRDPFGNVTPSRPDGDRTASDRAAAAAGVGEGPAADAFPWLDGMNLLRGRRDLSGTGRVLVARAVDARLAGETGSLGAEWPDEARLLADRTDPVRLLEELADGRPWIRLPGITAPALLGIIMRDAPDGARALAVVWQDRARPARVLNVVKDRRRGVVILNAETGRPADLSEETRGVDVVPLTAGINAPVAGTSPVFQGDRYTVQGEPAMRSWFMANEIGAERFGGVSGRPPGLSFAGQRDSKRLQKYLALTVRLGYFPVPDLGAADPVAGAAEAQVRQAEAVPPGDVEDAPSDTVFVGVRATPTGPAAFVLNLNEGGRLRVSGRTLAHLVHSALSDGPATEAGVASVTMIDWREGVPRPAAAEFADEVGRLLGRSASVLTASSANTWSGWSMNVKNGGRWRRSAARASETPEAVTKPRTAREWKALAKQVTHLMQQPYEDALLGINPAWVVRGLTVVHVPAPVVEWALGVAVATGAVSGPVSEAEAAASVLTSMFDKVWNTLDQLELNLPRDQIAQVLWHYIGERGARWWPTGLGAEATALRILQEFLAVRVSETLRKDYPVSFNRLDGNDVLPLVQRAIAGLEQPPPREVVARVTAAFIEIHETGRVDQQALQVQAKTEPAMVPSVSFELTLTGSVGGTIALPVTGTLTMDRIEELAARMVASFRQPYEGKNPPKWSTVAVEVPKGVAPESVAGVTQAVWKAAGLLDHGIYVKLYGWASPLRICP